MNEKQIDRLLSVLESIERNLATLTLTAAVEERYPDAAQRASHRVYYDALLAAHKERQQEHLAVESADADQKQIAFQAVLDSNAELSRFEAEHGLLMQLTGRTEKLAHPHR